MRFPSFSSLLALAAFCVLAVIPFSVPRQSDRAEFFFEITLAASTHGLFKIYLDDGEGLREGLTREQSLTQSNGLQTYRLDVPACTLRLIRVDPVDRGATVAMERAQIVAADGRTVRAFAPSDFIPTHQIEELHIEGPRLTVVTTPGGNDPQLSLRLDPSLTLPSSQVSAFTASIRRAVLLFVAGLAGLVAIERSVRVRSLSGSLLSFSRNSPQASVAATALVAAIISCYPVVFQGRSFVSPNYADGTILLYDRFPTLPGYQDTTTENAKGSDVGAMAWAHGPTAMLQREALIDHAELPLWNRYNSTGTDLLGQGQLMFGDPLQFMVILADGAAWVWDVKYVLARFLFAAALGLTVLAATGFAPGALLTALTAPFIGFFLYRVNHPAFFSVCYAPLILLAWIRIVRAGHRRTMAPWVMLLVLANLMEMSSGTAKEAYMLIACMNLAGLLLLLHSEASWGERARRLTLLGVAGVLFLLMTAPLWLTFMDALRQSYTSYNAPAAFQIHPALFIGLFDELFFRPIHAELRVWNPSANILTLLGVLYVVATWRRTPPDPVKRALVLACLPPFILAFGVIPPAWIVKVPFLANIGHVDNTFSCALIILAIVLAGFGWKLAAKRLATSDGPGDLAVIGVIAVTLVVPWIALNQVIHREPFGGNTVLPIKHDGPWGPPTAFVWGQLAALLIASVILVWVVRRSLMRRTWTPAGALLVLTCLCVMLWRFGAQAPTHFDDFVFNPPCRVDFNAASPSIDFIREQQGEPGRVVGVGNVLMPGWSIAYRLEGINGPDALMNPFYRELTNALGIERIWDWRLVVREGSLAAVRRPCDMLNVRFYVGNHQIREAPPGLLLNPAGTDLVVLESPTAWPRAFFTDRVALVQTAADIGQIVQEGDGRPFASADPVTAAAIALPGELQGRTTIPARDYRLTPNSTSFTIDAQSRGLVVLQEAWQRGNFQARVDGKRAKWFRINHAFKGVMVEQAGRHVVSFHYWPRHMTLALVASALGLVGLAALWYAMRRNRTPALIPAP